jgi:hypothetical protein
MNTKKNKTDIKMRLDVKIFYITLFVGLGLVFIALILSIERVYGKITFIIAFNVLTISAFAGLYNNIKVGVLKIENLAWPSFFLICGIALLIFIIFSIAFDGLNLIGLCMAFSLSLFAIGFSALNFFSYFKNRKQHK